MSAVSHAKIMAEDRLGVPALRIKVARRADLEKQLDQGVELLRKAAEQRGIYQGIMAIRHSAAEFTLELCADVPFGTIREGLAWH